MAKKSEIESLMAYGTLDSSLGINLHWGGGIYCKNSSPAITGNIITSNETFAGGGISIYSGQPRISSNKDGETGQRSR
jgi:hypothetical protein